MKNKIIISALTAVIFGFCIYAPAAAEEDIVYSSALLTFDYIFAPPAAEVDMENGFEPEENGDWYYWDEGDYASVCGYKGAESNITVPSQINGKPVTQISSFYNNYYVQSEESGFFQTENKQPISLAIPQSVKTIEKFAFSCCPTLCSVSLPDGLVKIGFRAFWECENLTSIKIPSSVKIIGEEAFAVKNAEEGEFGNELSEGIRLSEGLEYIAVRAFSGCKFKTIKIPDTVKYMGSGAFKFCRNLEEITLPKGLSEIPHMLFSGCKSLKSIKVSEGVKDICEFAFYDCPSLEEIYLPSTVIHAFDIIDNSPALKNIYIAMDKDTAMAQIGEDPLKTMTYYSEDGKSSGIEIHYQPQNQNTEMLSKHDYNKTVFSVIAIMSLAALLISMTIYVIIKRKLNPKPNINNSHSGLQQSKSDYSFVKCEKCGAESIKEARYCYSCGKRLKK